MRILRGLSSKSLPCGCLAGVYETYDGLVVAIVDAKSTGCANLSHSNGKVVPTDDVPHVTGAAANSALR
jgi:hypothetical protein